MSPPLYTVAVRALCEFTAKAGDLDGRFTPAPSAQEGVLGHQAVAARRGPGYRAEVPLQGRHRHLVVRGRADGYDAGRGRLEEVKTHKGDLARLPANHRALHWAQARTYAWLLCEAEGLASITVALVYYDVGRGDETVLEETCEAPALRAAFEDACERFLHWADAELAHRAARDAALAALAFPHAGFRHGQRALAEAAYRAARAGRCLMAQAPTGIGKTLGTLFPLLKACPAQGIDQVAFLTAKGSGHALALDALATLRGQGSGLPPGAQGSELPRRGQGPGLPLRVLELVAREKSCERPGSACHGEACDLARGFYDRLPAARAAAVEVAAARGLAREALREVALAHAVCPYWLGQELARWSDVVVGDYNHWFDASALLHGLAEANGRRVALLVDEAHNLVERGRAMYSAELHHADLRAAARAAPPSWRRPLARLKRAWTQALAGQEAPHALPPAPPPRLATALHEATAAITEALADDPPAQEPAGLAFYFDALRLARLLDSFDTHSLFEIALRRRDTRHADSTLGVRNVLPAPFLAPRFAAAHACVLFSATLSPRRFYADTLGLPGDTAWVDVESPFASAQLSVRIVRAVSTRWRDRARSLEPIASLIAAQVDAQPGNYLAFFSSFEYLAQAHAAFVARHPGVPTWCQTPGMDAPAREAFLGRFHPEGQGVGFAVLGGSFAEGVDLPGRRLVGAFIATLGLPQVNPLNEAMRARMQAAFGAGYDYTYLYPGLRKVVQAAGRVIRTPEDRGSVLLIDDRFERVRHLLPAWWEVAPG